MKESNDAVVQTARRVKAVEWDPRAAVAAMVAGGYLMAVTVLGRELDAGLAEMAAMVAGGWARAEVRRVQVLLA